MMMIAVIFPTHLSARDFTYQGIAYTVIDEAAKTVEVTYNNYITGDVTLPTTVYDESKKPYTPVSIRRDAFYGCTGLNSVVIGNTVTKIGENAFTDCTGLNSVEIPGSVTEIGDSAFQWCSELTYVEIPGSITEIGKSVFSNCRGMTSIVIPNSVSFIGENAFLGCRGLTSVVIPNSVTSISKGAFSNCRGLTSIVVPNSVTSIGDEAFSGCDGLSSIVIPNSVTSIGKYAFSSCTGLSSVEIPNFVTEIGDWAFYWCSSLASVVIGNSVTKIGDEAFYRCGSLISVVIPNSVTEIGKFAFHGCALTNLVLPPSVQTVGKNAFSSNNLKSIVMGANLTSIGSSAFSFDRGDPYESISITAKNPPAADRFSFFNHDCPLYVIKDAEEAYRSSNPWSEFSDIGHLIEPTAVEIDGAAEYYNVKSGDTFKLTATVSPADVSLPYIFWRSTNPAFATVDYYGNVTIHDSNASDNGGCEIIAETLYADAPVAKVAFKQGESGIEDIVVDSDASEINCYTDIYNMQGICLKRNASQDDVNALAPGLYIVGGKKVLVK